MAQRRNGCEPGMGSILLTFNCGLCWSALQPGMSKERNAVLDWNPDLHSFGVFADGANA
jgi:hypothetical protein